MKPTDYIELFWKLAIIGFIIWFFFFFMPERSKQDREYWENINFKTDTLRLGIEYKDVPKIQFQSYVPPKVVINYVDSSRSVQHIHVRSSDSLIQVIDSLKNQITSINAKYLKLYPTAHKLIYGEFNSDSIQLDVLNINGDILTELYPINYSRFKYQYKDNQLRAEPLKGKKYLTSLYLQGGYDWAQSSIMLGGEYSIYKNRFSLSASPYLYLNAQPELLLQTKVGYKLK